MSGGRQRAKRASAERARRLMVDPFAGADFDQIEQEGFVAGQRAALDGMDLPDGAYLSMAEDMGIDPFDDDDFE